MDDRMEDGELPSSPEPEEDYSLAQELPENGAEIPFQDDILDDSNYVIIDRPKSSLPVAAKGSGMSTTGPVTGCESSSKREKEERRYQGPPPAEFSYQMETSEIFGGGGYEQFGKKGYYKRAGVSDLLDSDKESSSAASDDSDDDNFHGKRSRMAMPVGHLYQQGGFNSTSTSAFGCSSSSMSQGMEDSFYSQQQGTANDFFAAEAAKFQKQRKPNLVWSNVIQEEEISKLGHQVRVGGGLAEIEVTRGPETYFYERPKRPPRQRRESDSSDISSEGLSDNALHYLKDGTQYEEEDEEIGEGEPSLHSLPTSFKSKDSNKTTKATKRRRTRNKHKAKIIQKLKKMKSPELAKYMASKLNEEKEKLLVKSIETLGKEICIHIFLKTLKIEKRGGIMIKTQERRRTPGGVFLYLIRGDRRLAKNLIDAIFREDRAVTDKVRKKKIANKRLHKKVELETAKAALEETASTQNNL